MSSGKYRIGSDDYGRVKLTLELVTTATALLGGITGEHFQALNESHPALGWESVIEWDSKIRALKERASRAVY